MASHQATADYILEQAAGAGPVSVRRMFGEFALYLDGKVVAFICDDLLFVKPTPGGRAFLGEVTEAPPHPRAKPYFLIEGGRWDDAEWLAELLRTTARDLPAPRARRPARRERSPRPAARPPSS